MIYGLGFGVQGSWWVQDFGFRVSGSGFGVEDLGFRVWGEGINVWGFGSMV